MPANVVRGSLQLALGVLNVGVSLVGFVAHRTLPPPVLRRLQGETDVYQALPPLEHLQCQIVDGGSTCWLARPCSRCSAL